MKKVKRKWKRWTQEEIEVAKSLYERGMTFSEIGRELGRNNSSVRAKLLELRIYTVEKIYLYDIESVRGNIIDVEQAKITTYHSGKRLLFKCSTDGCDTIKNMVVTDLVRQGFYCPNCSTGISYSESFFTAYLEVKNIPYETQVIYGDLSDRRYDFRIKLNGFTSLVETHGKQHYYTEDEGYYKVETIQESDEIKRQYAKDNNINLIELDCRKSEFEFIQNSIAENNILPNIEDKEIPNMLELMELNSKYPVKKVIKMYKVDKKSIHKISKNLGYSATTIKNILCRNNIQLRDTKRMVRQIETGRLFSSITEAQRQTGIHGSNISMACNGKYKKAGGYNWEYVDNE